MYLPSFFTTFAPKLIEKTDKQLAGALFYAYLV